MTKEELFKKIEKIRVCSSEDRRAPHKPLLLLHALAKLQSDSEGLMPYREVKVKLRELLLEFGPSVKNAHSTVDPFLRLYNDKIGEIDKVNISEPNEKYILDNHVNAGFSNEVYHLLKGNNQLIKSITEMLLEKHFSDTLHDDILARVGLNLSYISIRKRRDPVFKRKVLQLYGNRCAICGFDVKLGKYPSAIEAAHIKSHKVGGSDIEGYGIALCAIHHKLFDQGAFTLNSNREILVSKKANGTVGLQDFLLDFAGKKIILPQKLEYQPKASFVAWHVREVFKCGYGI